MSELRSDRVPAAATAKPADMAQRPAQGVSAVVILIAAAAILYVARDVLQPLAIGLLLTFALAPVVSFLRKRHVPRILAVVLSVGFAFALIGVYSAVVGAQVAGLAQNIPSYQANIIAKVRNLQEMGAGEGILSRITTAVQNVGAQLNQGQAVVDAQAPMPVEIIDRTSPITTLLSYIVPLISPFATLGLIIVLVIFMLLEREELRDRFIRLVGYDDLHRTTQALQDAGRRVGRYLLAQLLVNTLYAVPITVGLWLLGIPNALLWGSLTLVLRFIPYVGPILGMVLPLFLAVAVAPGWSLLLWTAALFIGMELISNNIVEPWLYGSRTGLSSLAIIVAAIFWTWLWGPLGLLLSTPLTVCLVVLGRHVPQFSYLNVLLGNEPVLEPHARLYQRLLAGDPEEATDHAETYLAEEYLVDFYDEIGVPALILGEKDRQRGVLSDVQRVQVRDTVHDLIANLNDIAEEEENDVEASEDAKVEWTKRQDTLASAAPDGTGKTVLCMGGRGDLDDAAAMMVAQCLEVLGAEAETANHQTLRLDRIQALPSVKADAIVVVYLNPRSLPQARQVVRRLKRMRPNIRIGLLVPDAAEDRGAAMSPDTTNADFVAGSIAQAIGEALSDTSAIPLRQPQSRIGFQRKRLEAGAA
ncbi:AI-2E family transporter [Aureimonas frigidaquae]|uniref:AI-2E family transporter n=1 Tax=Aureimonas frigidaquae TaxID=424757 RepID=UPI00078662D2|nr:AI-2E family transporter [Aureimonas frigidaquae]